MCCLHFLKYLETVLEEKQDALPESLRRCRSVKAGRHCNRARPPIKIQVLAGVSLNPCAARGPSKYRIDCFRTTRHMKVVVVIQQCSQKVLKRLEKKWMVTFVDCHRRSRTHNSAYKQVATCMNLEQPPPGQADNNRTITTIHATFAPPDRPIIIHSRDRGSEPTAGLTMRVIRDQHVEGGDPTHAFQSAD